MEPLNRDVLLDLMKEVLVDMRNVNTFMHQMDDSIYNYHFVISKMLFQRFLNCNVLISNDTLSMFMYILKNTKSVNDGESLHIKLFKNCYYDGVIIADDFLKIIGENTQGFLYGLSLSDSDTDILIPNVTFNQKLHILFSALKNNKRLRTLTFGTLVKDDELTRFMNNVTVPNITRIKGTLSHFKYLEKYNLKLKKVELNLRDHGWESDLTEFLRLPNIQCTDTLFISYSIFISCKFIKFDVDVISPNLKGIKNIKILLDFEHKVSIRELSEIYKFCSLFPKLESLNIDFCWYRRGWYITELIEKYKRFFTDNPPKFIIKIEVSKGYCEDDDFSQYKCYEYEEYGEEYINVGVSFADNVSMNIKASMNESDDSDEDMSDDDNNGGGSSDEN